MLGTSICDAGNQARVFYEEKANKQQQTHTHYIDTICINYQVGVFFSLSSIIEHTI